jgi:4-hydroxymandelate synthase
MMPTGDAPVSACSAGPVPIASCLVGAAEVVAPALGATAGSSPFRRQTASRLSWTVPADVGEAGLRAAGAPSAGQDRQDQAESEGTPVEITGVDHVEFYAVDARLLSFYLRGGFGFRVEGQAGPETGAPDRRSVLLSQGHIRLLVTSSLNGAGPAADFTRRHGDGAAVIAMRTDDARTAFRTAVAAGADPVREPQEWQAAEGSVVIADVTGPGDLICRLVERQGTRSLPGFGQAAAAGKDEDLLELIDHVAICVRAGELDGSVQRYTQMFGFRQIFEERIEVGDQAMNSKVVQSPSGGVTFTLLEPDTTRAAGQIDGFLSRHGGGGVQHLAFLSRDIVGTVDRLTDRGVRFLSIPDSYYDQIEQRFGSLDIKADELRRVNVLADRDHWGEVFQIFSQPATVRDTYFTEIIERRGARTFGSGNIKALYQAVQRDREV